MCDDKKETNPFVMLVFIVVIFSIGFVFGRATLNVGWENAIREGRVSLVVSTNVVTNVVKEIVVEK